MKKNIDLISEYFSPEGFKKHCQNIDTQSMYERNHSYDYWISRGSSNLDNLSAAGPDTQNLKPDYINYLETICNSKNVLELCVGSGRIAKYIEPISFSYRGIERSQTMIDRIQPNIKEKIICADVSSTFQFEDCKFDLVIIVLSMTSVFYHIENIYKESMRVLKDGGKFIIIENYKTLEFKK